MIRRSLRALASTGIMFGFVAGTALAPPAVAVSTSPTSVVLVSDRPPINGTHYSKVDEPACYKFHGRAKTGKINDKGNYVLKGQVKFKRGDANYDLDFTFKFVVTAP